MSASPNESDARGLTPNQRQTLRAIVRAVDRDHRPYPNTDGNFERTARSLVRRRLAYWTPQGTRAAVLPTYAGREAASR